MPYLVTSDPESQENKSINQSSFRTFQSQPFLVN